MANSETFDELLKKLQEAHVKSIAELSEELKQLRNSSSVENLERKSEDTSIARTDTLGKSAFGQPFRLWPEWKQDAPCSDDLHFLFRSTSESQNEKLHIRSPSAQNLFVLEASGYVILPFSQARVCWDLWCLLCLLFDCIWVPMAAFNPPDMLAIAIIDWMVLITWSIDIPLNFLTAYHTKKGLLVTNHREIARNYMQGWFLVDVIVVGADWATATAVALGTAASATRIGKVFRITRILRTLRLLRVMKLRQILFAVQERIDWEYLSIIFALIQNVMLLLAVNHVVACIWFWIGSGPGHWVEDKGVDGIPVFEQYMISLHWSLTQFTPAGIPLSPKRIGERVFNVILIVVAMIGFSTFVSSITAAMTRMRGLQQSSISKSFVLRKFLNDNHISADLQARISRYISLAEQLHKQRVDRSQVPSLHLISGPLNMELQTELHSPHLVVHELFKTYCGHQAAAQSLCLAAVTKYFYSKGDLIFSVMQPAAHMYFMSVGSLAYQRPKGMRWDKRRKKRDRLNKRRVVMVHRGEWASEGCLWVHWRHRGTLQAVIESETHALDAEKFRQVTVHHHDVFYTCRAYSHEFVDNLWQNRAERGCNWDLPKDMITPLGDVSQTRAIEALGSLRWEDVKEVTSAEQQQAQFDYEMSDSEESLEDQESNLPVDSEENLYESKI